MNDLKYALRLLVKWPGFTAVAVLTLALGIGANTAIFSVVEAVLLRPLPYKQASRLLDVVTYRPGAIDRAGVAYPDYLVWKQQNTVFEETAAYYLINASNDVVFGGPFSAERARYSIVTNNFFSVLGVQPEMGRGFVAGDEVPGGEKVFLVSDSTWRNTFHADPGAINKTFLLDGEVYTLIGVMPRRFDFPKGCGIWLPTSAIGESGLHDRLSHSYHVLGRLRPGVTRAQAEAQLETVQSRLAKTYAATDSGWHVQARPLLDEIIGNVRRPLLVLLGAVGFILLIACTNVLNLMLARASVREREFAIRSSLGASRARLVRQGLTESFVLVCMGSVLGIVFANWGLALIVTVTGIHLPRMESFDLNVPVLAFLTAVSVLMTMLVGLVPALRSSRQDPQSALREGRYGSGAGIRRERLLGSLVVTEVALALLLLCGAGLMLRSFMRLNRVNPGFESEHLLTMKIALPSGAYARSEQTAAYFARLLERVQTLPGVQSAAWSTTLPLSGESDWGTFLLEGNADWTKASAAGWRGVSVGLFRTMGIPLLRGREFVPSDFANQNTVVINQAMARKFWPGTDPVGKRIFIGHRSEPLQVIGIVGDVKGAGLNVEAAPEMYTLPRGLWYAFLVVRTNQEPAAMAATIRNEIVALDRTVPVYQISTMDELLALSVTPARFNLFLLLSFAVLALGLAAVGIYGVLAFRVSRSTHDIGVRLALGAGHREVFRLVLGQGMALVSRGVVLGIAGAFAMTRLMTSLLFGVSATDPLTFVMVTILLSAVAVLACYVPARRATQVDPMVALRYE